MYKLKKFTKRLGLLNGEGNQANSHWYSRTILCPKDLSEREIYLFLDFEARFMGLCMDSLETGLHYLLWAGAKTSHLSYC
jgi:hypothetical protein